MNLLHSRSVFRAQRRSLATAAYNAASVVRNYPVGLDVHGYKINNVLPVPELSLTAVELTHSRTGSKHLHIDRADKNNVFSIIFKTNPPNSTGVPHILEHTTLCGSYTYPVRDPFFKMINRSLSNFMNAMTGHDYTFYPFASTNQVDFENLRKIYLSSVFEPLLKEEDFHQEGWRLENEVPEDKNSPLIFKGVVYNEMKGQVSNASYYHWIKFQESIYPSLNNSGGDPSKITDLSYQDLLDFHSENYHPSNSKTYTYGDIPLRNHLEKLDESFKHFGKRSVKNVIKKPIELEEIKEFNLDGPIDPMANPDKQHKSSVTWFVGNPSDVYNGFCWKILSNLLIDGHSSSFYQELIESGYGDEYSVNTGLDSTTSLSSFTIGLQGLTESNSASLSEKILSILRKVSEDLKKNPELFNRRVEAIIHQLELSKKNKKSDFGMGLLYSIAPNWANDINPFDILAFDDLIFQFKQDYVKKDFFANLIERNLLEKPYVKFTMTPNAEFETELLREEEERLARKVSQLDDEDREIVHKRGLHLLAKQNEKEDVSCLPTLTMKDIPVKGETIPLKFSTLNDSDSPLQKRITDTNGLTYFRALKPIPHIPEEYIPYLPLFTDCLLNLGTTNKDMSELEDDIKLYTGGLSARIDVRPSPTNISEPILQFHLSGVSLNNNVNKIFDIWSELLNHTNFDNVEKLSTLIRSLASNNISGIAESGHVYARNYAAKYLTPVKYIQNFLGGIGQVQFINQLNKIVENNEVESKLIPILKELQALIVNNSNFRYNLICDSSSISENEKLISNFHGSQLSSSPNLHTDQVSEIISNFNTQAREAPQNTLINLPFQVNYASLALPGVPYVEKDGAALQVASQLLTFKHLHKELREKGGAYGAGLSYGGTDGILGYYTYRDPNPMNSIEAFKKSGEFAASQNWSDSDLQEAKLTLFQSFDAPINVSDEGVINFRNGITDDMRQTRRENILGVGNQDIKNAVTKYLVEDLSKSRIALVGNKNEKINDDWKIIEMSSSNQVDQ